MNKEYLSNIMDGLFNFVSTAERVICAKNIEAGDDDSSIHFKKYGWINLEMNFSKILPLEYDSQKDHSQYLTTNIVKKESIYLLIHEVLLKGGLKSIIQNYTGMSYSVDYFVDYTTRGLPEELSNTPVYANQWHRDLGLTPNTVKIFILVDSVGENDGPLTWLDSDETEHVVKKGFERDVALPQSVASSRVNVFTGSKGKVCMVKPRICLHKAGIPTKNNSREQIMIQLNPARNWSVRTDLYEKQYFREPTLPFLRNYYRPKSFL